MEGLSLSAILLVHQVPEFLFPFFTKWSSGMRKLDWQPSVSVVAWE